MCLSAGSSIRPRLRFALALACLLLLPTSLQAQTPVPANTAVRGVFNPSPDASAGYRCYLDGKLTQELPATARQCDYPPLPPGTYEAAVSAFNAFGESAKLTASFVTGLPPIQPSDFRIEVATATVLRISPRAGTAQVESITTKSTLLP